MKKFIIIICALVLGLCACGSKQSGDTDNPETSAITLKKDGSIESRLVENFGTYSEDGLKSLIESSITEYQKLAASAQISLKSCEKNAQEKLSVEMTFNDAAAYAGWNNYFLDYMYATEMGVDIGTLQNDTQGFFAGTISDAYAAGYSLETTMTAVSDNRSKQSVTKADLLSMGDSHIVILECYDEESVTVNCYDEILYVGDGVTAAGKKSAIVSNADGYGMIVFK